MCLGPRRSEGNSYYKNVNGKLCRVLGHFGRRRGIVPAILHGSLTYLPFIFSACLEHNVGNFLRGSSQNPRDSKALVTRESDPMGG